MRVSMVTEISKCCWQPHFVRHWIERLIEEGHVRKTTKNMSGVEAQMTAQFTVSIIKLLIANSTQKTACFVSEARILNRSLHGYLTTIVSTFSELLSLWRFTFYRVSIIQSSGTETLLWICWIDYSLVVHFCYTLACEQALRWWISEARRRSGWVAILLYPGPRGFLLMNVTWQWPHFHHIWYQLS